MSKKIAPKENHELKKLERKRGAWRVVGIVAILVIVAGVASAGYMLLGGKLPSGITSLIDTSKKFGQTDVTGEARKVFYSPYSGVETTEVQSKRRAFSVMYGADPVARPLSGLSQADMVFEMAVTPSQITRLMGVYQSHDPSEIGSIRSARSEFIDLSKYIDAVFVHWGGSHYALDTLKGNVIDEVDALTEGSAFYRVARSYAPFNGFSTADLIRKRMKEKSYKATTDFNLYTFVDDIEAEKRPAGGTVVLPYPGQFQVSYEYDQITNVYTRYQAGKLQTDRNNSLALKAKNVVVLYAPFSQLKAGEQYVDNNIHDGGKCAVYQNGTVIPCTWKKGTLLSSPLILTDLDDEPIPFVRGATWFSFLSPSQPASWKEKE